MNSAEPETAEYQGVLSISRRKNFSRRPASHSTSPIWCHQGCETLTKMVRGLSAAQERVESQPSQPYTGWKLLVRRNRSADSRYFAEDLAHRPILGHIKPFSPIGITDCRHTAAISPTGPTTTPSSLCFPSHQLREVWTAKPSIWKTMHTACQIKNKHADWFGRWAAFSPAVSEDRPAFLVAFTFCALADNPLTLRCQTMWQATQTSD